MPLSQRRSKTENYPVKNTVNGTQGTFPRNRRIKNNPVKITVIRYIGNKAIFSLKSKTVNQQVRYMANGAQRTMLLYLRGVRLKITQSEIPLMGQEQNAISQERIRLKISQSLALMVRIVKCYFLGKQ